MCCNLYCHQYCEVTKQSFFRETTFMSSSWDCTSKSSTVWKQKHRCYAGCYWIISVEVAYPYLLPHTLHQMAHQDFTEQNQEKHISSTFEVQIHTHSTKQQCSIKFLSVILCKTNHFFPSKLNVVRTQKNPFFFGVLSYSSPLLLGQKREFILP